MVVFLIVLLHADLLVGLNVGFGGGWPHKSASTAGSRLLSHQTRGVTALTGVAGSVSSLVAALTKRS